jgi:deoxyribonuclease-4
VARAPGRALAGRSHGRPRFGVHVSIEDSLAEAPRRAAALGCECFQIFAGPPRNWKRRRPGPDEAEEFKRLCREHDLRPVVVHAGYLVHLVSASAKVARASRGLVRREMEIASTLGADYYAIHPGSVGERPRGAVLDELARAIKDAVPEKGPMVLLENVATARVGIGARYGEMAELLERLGGGRRFGVVLDTAHAVGAGYDLTSAEGVGRSLREIYRAVGRSRVKLVHANDTRVAVGSNRDLHESVGRGRIGREGFTALMRDATLSRLPFILETPVRRKGDDQRNLRRIREFAREAASPYSAKATKGDVLRSSKERRGASRQGRRRHG